VVLCIYGDCEHGLCTSRNSPFCVNILHRAVAAILVVPLPPEMFMYGPRCSAALFVPSTESSSVQGTTRFAFLSYSCEVGLSVLVLAALSCLAKIKQEPGDWSAHGPQVEDIMPWLLIEKLIAGGSSCLTKGRPLCAPWPGRSVKRLKSTVACGNACSLPVLQNDLQSLPITQKTAHYPACRRTTVTGRAPRRPSSQ
jgi:hypothetical protein